MFANKTRVLLTLPQDVLDRVRVMAGKATTALKLPVSVQIVLRALLEEGLKRDRDRILLANIESQARAVRRIRGLAARGGGTAGNQAQLRSESSGRLAGRGGQGRKR